ncbi:DUF4251 domain-containing protein [Flagellimonas myxillae]|uniref:DUF4251 domain-containing protein n=1 Tax=Flagellimonas myxillae TaxID=2942214 RepID=UPI00201F9411|nr:DUF4251 domain-containing protein [Muricauda myxillae]MCL6265895.1 DUF4251 domain-containing protein [Muricauda myxillae]
MGTVKKAAMGLLAILAFACGTSKNSTLVTEADIQALHSIVEEGNLEIRAQWARPLLSSSMVAIANSGLLAPQNNAGRIDLTGNPAFLRMVGDSVSAYLPYYGERNMTTGYGNTNNAIQFEGTALDFELKEDEKSDGYVVNFNIANDSETYTVFARMLPGKYSTISVNSSHRQSINYSGEVLALNEE